MTPTLALTLTATCAALTVLVVAARGRQFLAPCRAITARSTLTGRPTRRRRRRRTRRPGDVEVARWCERVAAALRSGRSLSVAVDEADAATPVDQRPFPGVAHATRRGRPLADAVRSTPDGPGSPVGLLAPVLVATAELGGPATSIDRVASTLLGRAAERDERRTASAQARLSARVLTILPLAVLAVLAATEPAIRSALLTPAGLICVTAGLAANGLGAWWMHRLIGGAR